MSDPGEWMHNIMYGVGGLVDFERYELAAYHGCPADSKHDEHKAKEYLCWAGTWALHCLVNPDHAEMLAAIVAEAEHRKLEEAK